MSSLLGWILRIVGAFLWIGLVIKLKDGNPGWVSDGARYLFYTVTSIGGLVCFGIAQALMGRSASSTVIVAGAVVTSNDEVAE